MLTKTIRAFAFLAISALGIVMSVVTLSYLDWGQVFILPF
jgi:hypothetical protein